MYVIPIYCRAICGTCITTSTTITQYYYIVCAYFLFIVRLYGVVFAGVIW